MSSCCRDILSVVQRWNVPAGHDIKSVEVQSLRASVTQTKGVMSALLWYTSTCFGWTQSLKAICVAGRLDNGWGQEQCVYVCIWGRAGIWRWGWWWRSECCWWNCSPQSIHLWKRVGGELGWVRVSPPTHPKVGSGNVHEWFEAGSATLNFMVNWRMESGCCFGHWRKVDFQHYFLIFFFGGIHFTWCFLYFLTECFLWYCRQEQKMRCRYRFRILPYQQSNIVNLNTIIHFHHHFYDLFQ